MENYIGGKAFAINTRQGAAKVNSQIDIEAIKK